jgi:subtilisin-like proprotein convertase family protein
MKQTLLRSRRFLILFSLLTVSAAAQDTWTPSELSGFGDNSNHTAHVMRSFKGNIYAGTGDYTGVLYSSPTGNMGTWTNTFTAPYVVSIDDIAVTAEGAGFMYISAYAYGGDFPKVYRSVDGASWAPFYSAQNRVSHIVPFRGQGTTDSIYTFEDGSFGTLIKRAPYNIMDPLDTLGGTWDTVMDFAAANPYTFVKSKIVYNGKIYAGTSNGGMLWSTADGTAWLQNTSVGSGFGDANNSSITALGSFGGFLYAATNNYTTGAQIWRSNDEITWTLVDQFPGYETITGLETAGGQLWVALNASATSTPALIMKSSDGLSFSNSAGDGFGKPNNLGLYGNFCVFGNNIYYACENYGYTPVTGMINESRGIGYSSGAQIWRTCLMAAPAVSAGADQVVCQGTPASFTASAGFTAYLWEDGTTTQSLSTFIAGDHYLIATDANGCDALDTASLAILPVPDATIINPAPASTVCAGSAVSVSGTAVSNVRLPQPPVSRVCNVPVDYSLGNTYDTINVTGYSECSCTALYSVTIDSLYHQYDGDVSIGLYSPSGYFINLVSGAYGTDFIGTEFVMTAAGPAGNTGSAPFTGQFLPIDPFSSLTGPASGNWVIQLNDNYISDNGILRGWTLKFSIADSILTYSWNPSTGVSISTSLNTAITPPATSAYILTTTNSLGCTDKDTLSFFVPAITAVTTGDSLCYGMSATLTSDGTVNTAWTPSGTLSSSTGTSVIAMPSVTTLYYASDVIAGCTATDSVLITVNAPVTVSAGADKSICFGDSTAINGVATGGTPPYVYLWTGGSTAATDYFATVGPPATTTYNFLVTDAFGCTVSDSSQVIVMPSTDIYGHVGAPGGVNVAGSNVLLYKYYPVLVHFDTVQTTVTDASGNYHFASVNHADYLVEVFPAASYTTLVPTYYGNKFMWDSATVVNHYCGVDDTLNIMSIKELSLAGGPGYLHGRIVEDTGYVRVPGDPVPGVDVKLGRNPGGQLVAGVPTDGNGEYEFMNVPLGNYTVYVDIPGLGRDSSYTFSVDSVNMVYNYLDYTVDSTTIHIVPNAGVSVQDLADAPDKFSVYPNPSKGNATIEYTIGIDTDVSLGIYNMLGVKIAGIVNAHQQAGTYKYAVNDRNSSLRAGVYFVALITNGKTNIHKIIITE